LPDAGGWILLIGEPLGMLAVLGALWGKSLRRNFGWLWRHQAWRWGAVCTVIATIAFFTTLGIRVVRAQTVTSAEFSPTSGISFETNTAAPRASLIDQHGQVVELSSMRGSPTILTFTYGHCSTVCPSIIADLRMARQDAKKSNVRIVVITLDPWRDVPERLPTLAAHWKLGGDDIVLSGEVPAVESALDKLAIGRKRNETTGDIDHATTVMLLDEHGRIRFRVEGGGKLNYDALIRKAG
jgi:cytochrome oxidase Cu insertion factor (SCO1/SenC/PrrC family)